VQGRQVATLVHDQLFEAGEHRIAWRAEGTPAARGLYFVRIRTGADEWRQAVVRV
jgi:hypothetical protein